jgi:hypothetical protein
MRAGLVRLLAGASALAVTACESMPDALTPSGPANASGTGQYAQLRLAYDKAAEFQIRIINQQGDTSGAQQAFATLAQVGMGVVRANCSTFFSKRGDNQQQINLARDVVALGGATATAISGVAGASALALSIIGVSTAALYGSIDTYTKNFLFGAENIEAVRTLTLKAVDEHATKVLGEPGEWSFDSAVGGIMDNQELCKPAAIAAAVRMAIRGGTVEAVGENEGARNQIDGTMRTLIAATVGFPSTPDDVLLATICWATGYRSMNANERAFIDRVLTNPPFFNGPANALAWQNLAPVVATNCLRLSSTTRAMIEQKIAAMKAQANGSTPSSAIMSFGVAAPATTGATGLPSRPASSRHFSINVR